MITYEQMKELCAQNREGFRSVLEQNVNAIRVNYEANNSVVEPAQRVRYEPLKVYYGK